MSKLESVPKHCMQSHDSSKVKVEAHGRRAVFSNVERLSILVVDVDCWQPGSDGLKADHVVVKPQVVDIVVELKGSDILHAIQQILATAGAWRRASGNRGMMGGLVICSHSPESSASLANRKIKLRDKNKIYLEVKKNNQTEYRFETFTSRKA